VIGPIALLDLMLDSRTILSRKEKSRKNNKNGPFQVSSIKAVRISDVYVCCCYKQHDCLVKSPPKSLPAPYIHVQEFRHGLFRLVLPTTFTDGGQVYLEHALLYHQDSQKQAYILLH
jgi:hypothetical protein